MADKYIAFLPKEWEFVPEESAVNSAIASLLADGILQGDQNAPESLRNGPNATKLWKDTDPKPALDGDGMGCDPGKMIVRVDRGELGGYAGENLEPVACVHCESELPYEEAQDGFSALSEAVPLDDDRYQMECYHCSKRTPSFGADFGPSGGYARFAIVFDGETSNRVEPNQEGMESLGKLLGTPLRFVQIFGW